MRNPLRAPCADARRDDRGFALLSVLLLLALLSAIALSFFTLAMLDINRVKAQRNGTRGFYAAEGGVNLRAETIRSRFDNFALPTGGSPSDTNACTAGNLGSGDFGCVFHSLEDRSVASYVTERPGNPRTIVVPRGEPFQNLTASVFDYDLRSVAVNTDGATEAQLDLALEARLIPLFQFMVFFDKDLELTPGPSMTFNGPIHTNGFLYVDPFNTLDITGDVTVAGNFYRGRKHTGSCRSGTATVLDPVTPRSLPTCSSPRTLIGQSDVTAWNGAISLDVDQVTVPPPSALDPMAGSQYWDRADLRVVLDLTGTPSVTIRNGDNSVDAARTGSLVACANSPRHTATFYSEREGTSVDMLDVDVDALLDCAHTQNLLEFGRPLDDTSEGGLVLYLGVLGPNQAGLNNYGVRLSDGDELAADAALAPDPVGVTFVTNQAIFTHGDFNSVNKRPAALLADSFNVLSEGWSPANWPPTDHAVGTALSSRGAATTTVNAAVLAGTDTTGGADGLPGQDSGSYSGGVHNMPRHHEDWTGVTFNYMGSLVSLNEPLHVDGALVVGYPQYSPPNRNYAFDTDFNDPAKLPPMTPRFTYLKQRMYIRDFEM